MAATERTDRLSKPAFVRQMAAAWRNEPRVTHVFEDTQKLELEVRTVDETRMTIHLESFYAEYRRHGDLSNEVQRMLLGIGEFSAPGRASLEDIRARLLPKLEPLYQVQAAEKERPIRRLWRPWEHGLVITYVVDAPHSVRYLTEDDRNQWDVAQRDLHTIAVNNFIQQKLTNDVVFDVEGDEGEERLITCEVKDGYAATRTLFPSWILSRLAGVLTFTPYISIPQRDTLIVADIAKARSKQTFKRLAKQLFDAHAHRYRQTADVWSIADAPDIRE